MVDVMDTLIYVNIFRYFIATFGIFGNLFVLFLFVKYSKLRKSTSNLFVTLLCVNDVFIGIGIYTKISFIIWADSRGYTTYEKIDCLWANFTQGLGIVGNQFIIFAIAVDRFVAVYNPTGYMKKLNGSYRYFYATIFGMIFINIFANNLPKFYGFENSMITVCASGASSGPYFPLVVGINNVVFGALVFVIYFATIYFLIKNKNSKKSSKTVESQFAKIQSKVLKSVSLILISYTICYGFPSVMLSFQQFFKLPSSIAGYATTVMGFGTGINSCIDIFIFLFKYPDINDAACHFIEKYLKIKFKVDFVKTTPNSNVQIVNNSSRR